MDINTNVIIPIMPTAVVNILFFSSLEILFPLEKITIITAIMGTIIIVIPCAKMMSSKGSDPNMWAIMAPIKITNIIMARTLIFRRLLMPNTSILLLLRTDEAQIMTNVESMPRIMIPVLLSFKLSFLSAMPTPFSWVR